MTTHRHHYPISHFALDHPYASDWLLLTLGTAAALLLWYWNS
ncbi:MAG: hypothetical protein H6P99_1350 [Holophagaceae bacterium]|nr:hypothetical protein [Holophagaceae bacterium]